MAIRLEIDNADGRGPVDYTRYVTSPEQSPAVLRDRLNEPTLFDFVLEPADDGFVEPRRSAYVRLTSTAALSSGGQQLPLPIFTGYITSEASRQFLGVQNGRAVYTHLYQATSEEYLLNIKRLGPLPPFLNQTAGQILRFLTDYLQPGRFEVTGVEDGVFIPLFVAEAGRSWSELATELAERSRFGYRVLDSTILFKSLVDLSGAIVLSENDRRFRPESLEVSPVASPIHNDVTVLGLAEPQALVVEHFIGDGFTSKFPLSASVHGAESARLLVDDFTSTVLDTTRWLETDPNDYLTPFEGRLNASGGDGSLGETTLLARQVVELAGELELIHGEFEFTAPSIGILGGLYSDVDLAATNCLIGFDAAPIGGSTRLRTIVQGSVEPTEVVVDPSHHYILVTRLSASQPHRLVQTFPSLDQVLGGTTLPADIRVTMEVRDIDPADPAAFASLVIFETVLTGLPAFAFYAPINSADLNLVVNFLQMTQPIQARLETQMPGAGSRLRPLGFGIASHDATITSDPNNNQWALEFYEDTIPVRGEKIELRYRAAGRAQARVQSAGSILDEAAVAGDDGVRSIVLDDLTPAPRTSAEAEIAAKAYLLDHLLPQYEGRYGTWRELLDAFPWSGALLQVENPSRYSSFSSVARSVTSELHELGSERIRHTIEFGRPSRFQELLQQFAKPMDVLKSEEPAPAIVEAEQVGSYFLQEEAVPQLSNISSANYTVELAPDLPSGGTYEVRRTDQGWSTATTPSTSQNLIASLTQQSLLIPRATRKQRHFIRVVDSEGRSSRYSALLAVHYPLVPPVPELLSVSFGLNEGAKPIIAARVGVGTEGLIDIDLVELRDSDDVTVLAVWNFGQLRREGDLYLAEAVLDNSEALLRSKTLIAYTQNVLGEYSAPKIATGTKTEPAKPILFAGDSVGQVLELRLDRVEEQIIQTQIQVASPDGSFGEPAQDVLIQGQAEKFSFVASTAGGWSFRARRRDALGWTPWSDEPQGQLPAQTLVFLVQFFQARELDPSIGAAINSQNLLPNSEFFLPGIAGQEGIHSARYFQLINAASDGAEVDYVAATNEMGWKAGVTLSNSNPGFGALLDNLGRLFNPGESVTFSAALRHSGPLTFGYPVRLALRSGNRPSYDQATDLPTGKITGSYQWFSATFALSSGEAVPDDLVIDLAVVIPGGQSLDTDLFCDKLILNRGHRPAAFSLALWDLVALVWNGSTMAYSLPSTVLAATPRTSDPGNAGSLVGTGTDDLDGNFAQRYFRVVV